MFKLIRNHDIQYYISDLMPENVIHAFTTRTGGDAPPPLDTFSMGTAQFGEHREIITKNRQTICSVLNVNYNNLVMTDQHHTDNIAHLESVNQLNEKGYLENTDAVIIKETNIPVMLFFADCIPVMLYDKTNKILGLVHAGWKGTAKKIAPKTLNRMIQLYGTNPDEVIAAIGPGIGKCCYEVSDDVSDQLIESLDGIEVSYDLIQRPANKPYVDLKLINAQQLKNMGVNMIDVIPECTACNQNLFFSHRATRGQTGRHALIAQLV